MEGVTSDPRLDVLLTVLSALMTQQVLLSGIGHGMYDNDHVKMMWVGAIERAHEEGIQLGIRDMANINCKPLLAYQCQAVVARKQEAAARDDVMEE